MDPETTTKTPTPAPVVDHQGERPTYADVATEEDCDVVQTSALDVANAEIARLAAKVARLTHERSLRALERQSVPAVRLEWGKWDGEKINRVQLWVFTGNIAHNIAQIAIDHEIGAALWLSDMRGERTIKVSALEVTNENLTKIAGDLSILLAAAGLTMPPVPALPEKA